MALRHRVERFARLVEAAGRGRHHRRDSTSETRDPGLAEDTISPLARRLRDTVSTMGRAEDGDTELAELVGVSQRLAAIPAPEVDPEFRGQLRAQLMAAVEREGIGTNAKTQVIAQVRKPSRVSRARLAIVVGVGVGTLALSGVSMASTEAVPGDALYSVKRSSEQAQLMFAGNDANRGNLHLEFAKSRLVEAHQVSPDVIAGVLSDMDDEISQGTRLLFSVAVHDGSTTRLESVLAFVQEERADLIALRAQVREADQPAQATLDLLTGVEARANQLRAAIADHCAIAASDDFGPKPTC